MHTIQNQGSAAMNRKQVFAISSHIYQTVSQDYLLLHKIFVPQSFTKHSYPNITRTSAKATATSHVKTDYKKSIWAYTATIIIIISPIVDTKPKISTLSIRIIRITSHYLKCLNPNQYLLITTPLHQCYQQSFQSISKIVAKFIN